jgi:hypothetical protein
MRHIPPKQPTSAAGSFMSDHHSLFLHWPCYKILKVQDISTFSRPFVPHLRLGVRRLQLVDCLARYNLIPSELPS